jgi:RNA polymerase sigma factor (sigma-70 family)
VVVLSVDATDPTPDPAAEHALSGVAGSDALQRAINRLTVDQRSILALHHLEERPVAEIAATLGVPVGTAKWRLHDARRALERAMEAER